jgi:hypothetical protein
MQRRCRPEENDSRDQSPNSNYLEALLAQRKSFEAILTKNQKLLSNEQVPLARGTHLKHQMKDEIAKKRIARPRAAQRERKNLGENSIPKRILIARGTYL